MGIWDMMYLVQQYKKALRLAENQNFSEKTRSEFSLKAEHLSAQNLKHVRALNDIAAARGQSLAQMAVAWVLRDARVTSALIGASNPAQIVDLAGAMQKLAFTPAELAAIDRHAVEGGINLWQRPSTDQRPA